MEKFQLAKKIKERAHQLGFELVGIASPEPPPHLEVYQRWLKAGRHGEMRYLEEGRAISRRADPKQILPDCKSILVLGVPYDKPSLDKRTARGRGRIAAYAWGDDYHSVLALRLRQMVSFIEQDVGHSVPNRWYTDTGPLLEREFAQRAGLGWIGKNTMLINPERGSYFLLAEILLGIELEPDSPVETDHCGTCTRCIKACPTGCILPDRTLDAERCISYLTIEVKGPIPTEHRPPMADWIFGCDVCQTVCPWNERFASREGDQEFSARQRAVDLEAELQLSSHGFNRKFKNSPIKRTKRRGYLRNVAIALGNKGEQHGVPALRESLLTESESLVRGHAAWALGAIGGEKAHSALKDALENERDEWVVDEIRSALTEAAG